ncbi:MAG: hypothetical protein ACXVHQ_39045 [Solirubrobacteraceae bacterium]
MIGDVNVRPTDLPPGTVGLRMSGKIKSEDYDDLLVAGLIGR